MFMCKNAGEKRLGKKLHRFQSALDECFTVSENSTFTSFVDTTIVPGQPVGFYKDADRLKLICQSDGIASGRVTCSGNNPVLVKIRVHCSLTLQKHTPTSKQLPQQVSQTPLKTKAPMRDRLGQYNTKQKQTIKSYLW